ncbi:MAG: helix-turn-helix domain-containing protein [bacterium]
MDNILPSIEPGFPDARMLQSQIYPSANLVIVETSYLTLEECACNQYHFMIPLRQAPLIRTGNRLYQLREMSVFPCNPLQPHQIEDTGLTDFMALVFYLEKTFLQTVAEEMFGRRDIELNSTCFLFSPALRGLTAAFIRECRTGQPGSSLARESLTVQAAILLLRESRHSLSFTSFQPEMFRDKKCIAKAVEYLRDNYESKISLAALAAEMHYSPYHLLRLFKQNTGKTPSEFLLALKIEKARQLLQSTDYTMTHVCDICGFSGLSYFSQVFRRKTGLTPTQYRSQFRRSITFPT